MKEQLSARDSIVSAINDNPGIHFREIQRKTGLAVGQLEYHLYQLENDEEISIREDGNTKRYFSANFGTYQERLILFYLRSNNSRDILQKLSRYDFVPLQTLMKVRKSKKERRRAILEEMKNDGIIGIYNDRGLTQVKIIDRTKLIETARKYRESILGLLSENFISLLDDEL